VRDHEDQCPHQADGLHPDPARPGCPLPDRDGDNVPDAEDACPTRAGAPSTDPHRNGCPGLVRVENDQIRILRPVFFAPGHERILPQSQPVLSALADALRANPRIRHLSIEGHTDETGASASNMDLSRRRAESVRDWLAHHGVDADRLEPHGFGETRPIVPGHTPRANALNRRVEFRIVGHH
jgi:outer membrane protein OmpA-like peptidoglycan-associated protein